jgi:hypothetical protein
MTKVQLGDIQKKTSICLHTILSFPRREEASNMRPSTIRACATSLRATRRPITSRILQIIQHNAIRLASSDATSQPLPPDIPILTKHIQTSPGLTLSNHQHTIVSSILDLFSGYPTLQKLSLWRDDATFADPIRIATGREKYSAQWYALRSAFSTIDRLSFQVKDAGNPILIDLRMRYIVKGMHNETTVQSVVAVYLDGEGKVERVEDRWDGTLPEGMMSDVSIVVTRSCCSLVFP